MITNHTTEYAAHFHTNLLFVLADVMELALMDTSESCKAIGKELRYEDRMHFNRAIKEVRAIRSHLNSTTMDNQILFGESADEIYEMIVARADAD